MADDTHAYFQSARRYRSHRHGRRADAGRVRLRCHNVAQQLDARAEGMVEVDGRGALADLDR